MPEVITHPKGFSAIAQRFTDFITDNPDVEEYFTANPEGISVAMPKGRTPDFDGKWHGYSYEFIVIPMSKKHD